MRYDQQRDLLIADEPTSETRREGAAAWRSCRTAGPARRAQAASRHTRLRPPRRGTPSFQPQGRCQQGARPRAGGADQIRALLPRAGGQAYQLSAPRPRPPHPLREALQLFVDRRAERFWRADHREDPPEVAPQVRLGILGPEWSPLQRPVGRGPPRRCRRWRGEPPTRSRGEALRRGARRNPVARRGRDPHLPGTRRPGRFRQAPSRGLFGPRKPLFSERLTPLSPATSSLGFGSGLVSLFPDAAWACLTASIFCLAWGRVR